MTHEAVPKVVFDLSFFDPTNSQPTYLGYLCYRSDRIPDLYAHPMTPVQDLKVSFSVAGPRLQFSGDPNWSYTLEASTNQLQWQSLGTAMPGAVPDTYEFLDSSADLSTARFYRVVCR